MRLIIWIYGLSFVCPSASCFKSCTYHRKADNFCLSSRKQWYRKYAKNEIALSRLICTGQNTENTYSISISVKIYSEDILMYFIAVFHFRLRALLFLDMRFIRFTSLFMCESCRVRLCVVRFVIKMEILYHLKLQVTIFEVWLSQYLLGI